MPCKCSGKYIDIYFILKITYFPLRSFHTDVLLSLSFCVSNFGNFFWITAQIIDFGFFTLDMDSDHSSASQLDLLEYALDRPGTIMELSSAVDVSAVPSAATPLQFRHCAYGRRMSSKTHMSIILFVFIVGVLFVILTIFVTNVKLLTDKGFQTYIRHQRSLKRKSLSSLRPRARAADAATVATPCSLM